MPSAPHTIIASNNIELKRLIAEIIVSEGPVCNLNRIDVSRITSMKRLFHDSPFESDISKWDVSNVTDFWGMFLGSPFSGDLSKWNTKNAIDMSSMFHSSGFSGDISHWRISNVRSLGQMFHNNLAFQGDVSNWDVSRVWRFDHMFYESNWLGDLSNWRPHPYSTDVHILKSERMKHMAAPSVFHWKAIGKIPKYQQPESILAPSWLDYFYNVQGIIHDVAKSLHLSRHDEAQLYQERWLEMHAQRDGLLHFPLPELDI